MKHFIRTGAAALALAAAALLPGCALVAYQLAGALGSPDFKKIENARQTGFLLTFREVPAEESAGNPAPSGTGADGGRTAGTVAETSLILLSTSDYLVLEINRLADGALESKTSAISYPAKAMYALETGIAGPEGRLTERTFSFANEKALSRAVRPGDFRSLKNLAAALLSDPRAECAEKKTDEYRELELITECRGPDYAYKVESFMNYDGGFIIPEYFTLSGPRGETTRYRVGAVANVGAETVKGSLEIFDGAYGEMIERGLALPAEEPPSAASENPAP